MERDDWEEIRRTSQQQEAAQKKRYDQCAFYRICAVLCAVGFGIAGYHLAFWLDYALAALAAAAFVGLVKWHDRIEDAMAWQRAQKETAQAYLDRFGEEWKQTGDPGEEYQSETFPQGKDLDLFGPHSLYQYICMASTPFGRDQLAQWLKEGAPGGEDLAQRQQAVRELAGEREFLLRFQTAARAEQKEKGQAPTQALEGFLQAVRQPGGEKAGLRLLRWALPAVTLAAVALALLGVPRAAGAASLLCGLQLFFALLAYHWNEKQIRPVHRFQQRVAPYRRLAEAVEAMEFQSAELVQLRQTLQGAGDAMKELEALSESASARYNFVAFVLYNGLFLHDFHCVARIQAWRRRYGERLEGWLQALGQMEALISLGTLCHCKAVWCFPQISQSERPFLAAKDIRHPLIGEDKAVGNDFDLCQSICIITGSNMSGKTTFLRTIGVNLTLAYAGGAVAARECAASTMAICTSMRVEDDVSRGISTFYAELLRIKSIIDQSWAGAPMLVLIDEIYRGTNSNDRITGARQTICRLGQPHILTMVTTHDFELCDLEQEPGVRAVNYHFEEQYTEDSICFDYKIKKGRCRTTNAQHLLRLAGIL